MPYRIHIVNRSHRNTGYFFAALIPIEHICTTYNLITLDSLRHFC